MNSLMNILFQGKIACANVLSDVYAMGAVEVDNMLMLLSTSNKMSEKERDTIMPLVLQGFKVCSTAKIHHFDMSFVGMC